jgi:sigma-B regulation protein RsbU (phosphoserine phosphatase)
MKIRIGRVEIAFVVLLAIYILVAFTVQANAYTLTLKLVTSFFGCWAAIRVMRSMVTQMLWRLRNRLIVAYLFIALVPIVLITALVAVGTYLIGGRVSVYMVTSEMDRGMRVLESAAKMLLDPNATARSDWQRAIPELLRTRFPGLEVLVNDGNTRWVYPPDARIETPPAGWQEYTGLILKNGLLYGGVVMPRGDRDYFGVPRIRKPSARRNRNFELLRDGSRRSRPPPSGWEAAAE